MAWYLSNGIRAPGLGSPVPETMRAAAAMKSESEKTLPKKMKTEQNLKEIKYHGRGKYHRRRRLPVWEGHEDWWWRRRRRSSMEDWPPDVRAFFQSMQTVETEEDDAEQASLSEPEEVKINHPFPPSDSIAMEVVEQEKERVTQRSLAREQQKGKEFAIACDLWAPQISAEPSQLVLPEPPKPHAPPHPPSQPPEPTSQKQMEKLRSATEIGEDTVEEEEEADIGVAELEINHSFQIPDIVVGRDGDVDRRPPPEPPNLVAMESGEGAAEVSRMMAAKLSSLETRDLEAKPNMRAEARPETTARRTSTGSDMREKKKEEEQATVEDSCAVTGEPPGGEPIGDGGGFSELLREGSSTSASTTGTTRSRGSSDCCSGGMGSDRRAFSGANRPATRKQETTAPCPFGGSFLNVSEMEALEVPLSCCVKEKDRWETGSVCRGLGQVFDLLGLLFGMMGHAERDKNRMILIGEAEETWLKFYVGLMDLAKGHFVKLMGQISLSGHNRRELGFSKSLKLLFPCTNQAIIKLAQTRILIWDFIEENMEEKGKCYHSSPKQLALLTWLAKFGIDKTTVARANMGVEIDGLGRVEDTMLSDHYLLHIHDNEETVGVGHGSDPWDPGGHYNNASSLSSFFMIWDPGRSLLFFQHYYFPLCTSP